MSDEVVSKAKTYVESKGWKCRPAGSDQLCIYTCPYCQGGDWKFFINVSGSKTDGLHDCKHGGCQEAGNLWKLSSHCGDRIDGVQSIKELAASKDPSAPEPLPNVDACHARLMNDVEALDYLIAERGYTQEVIVKMKLGVTDNVFKKQGKVKSLVIPHLKNGECVYAKYRTLPPAKKEFDSSSGRSADLYNYDVLRSGLEEVFFVEGEGDALAALSNGVVDVVGVPGADMAKAAWIKKLDEIDPKRCYICFDRDKVGQEGAQKLAERIGLQRCYNIVLPEFMVEDEEGNEKPGKDLNEWFRNGGSKEQFDKLKNNAQRYEVAGTSNLAAALDKLKTSILTRGLRKEFDTPWPSGNKKGMGGDRGHLIVVQAPEKIGKTTFTLDWSDYLWEQKGANGLFMCLEVPEEELARKWVCNVTQTPDTPPKTDEENDLQAKVLMKAIDDALEIARRRERGDLLFGYSRSTDADEVFNTIEQAIRRYGLDYVVFDNLQLFADTTLRNYNHRTAHISALGKKFKKLATDFNIMVILIVQPHRLQEGKIVDANDMDGSSQTAKDCDVWIDLFRSRNAPMTANDFAELGFAEEDVTFNPQTLVKLSRTRNSPGGMFTLMFDGATSSFREFNETEHSKLPKIGGAMPINKVPQEAPLEA